MVTPTVVVMINNTSHKPRAIGNSETENENTKSKIDAK